MKNPIWTAIAAIATIPVVKVWLVDRAQRTPYTHIMSPDGSSCYMGRWWLFNPYPASGAAKRKGWGWLPSVRIHHIMRADGDRHHHDHPWNARTIILDGWYLEERNCKLFADHPPAVQAFYRMAGDTQTLKFGEYHRIAEVSHGGVWTLFITWKYRGTWGFDVDGVKVPWREYLGIEEKQ